jgi:putative ABC transport system permease protein
MTRLRVLLSRTLDLLLGRRREERLSAEIQAHLDELAEEYMAKGIGPAEARAAARREFGSIDVMKDQYRDQRGLQGLDAITRDIRFAGRLLRRDRGFAVTAVLVLGLGIGVNNMQFTIVNAHTIRGLPIDGVDRVVYVSTFDDRVPDRGVSFPELEDLHGRSTSFVGFGAFTDAPMVLSGDGVTADRLTGAFVSAGAIGVAGIRPLRGRTFTDDDDRPGAPPVALLTEGAWRTRYSGDPAAIGRSLQVNGGPATIVGIVSDRSGLPTAARVWIPLRQMPGAAAQARTARILRVFGRLRDGVTLEQARAEVDTLFAALAQDRPEMYKNLRARAIPINERFLGQLTDPTWLAFLTAGFLVLLISAANVANLMLARTGHRTRELAIRSALGASRGRVVRQLLVEGIVIATLGGALGLCLALAGVRIFRSAVPADALPYWIEYTLDARVVAALVLVSALTPLVFALLPAIRAAKTDVNAVLKEGGRNNDGRGRQTWASVFLAAEFGLAVVLLANFAVTLLHVSGPDLPFDDALDTRELLTATITLPTERYRAPADRAEFYRRLNERLQVIPDLSSSAVASHIPLGGAEERQMRIADRSERDDEPLSVHVVTVGQHYFEALGLRVIRGRVLGDRDGAPGSESVVVNEEFAGKFFAGADAIGQRIALTPLQAPPSPLEWATVVGIVPTVRQRPRGGAEPIVYVSNGGSPASNAVLLVRSSLDTAALTSLLRQEAAAIDADLPLYRIRTMQQARREAVWNGRVSNGFFLFLMWTSVGLAMVGLYAVTAHGVSQSTREIGMRMALGARPRQVMRVIVRRVAGQVAFGFGTGIVCTKIWSSMFSSGRDDVSLTDPASLLIVAAILSVVAALACFVPIWRATHLDPVAAIREA